MSVEIFEVEDIIDDTQNINLNKEKNEIIKIDITELRPLRQALNNSNVRELLMNDILSRKELEKECLVKSKRIP